jgi:hypothetical protein
MPRPYQQLFLKPVACGKRSQRHPDKNGFFVIEFWYRMRSISVGIRTMPPPKHCRSKQSQEAGETVYDSEVIDEIAQTLADKGITNEQVASFVDALETLNNILEEYIAIKMTAGGSATLH